MKYYTFLLITYVCLVGCGKEPTRTQLDLVDRLIQEQIDIPYNEPNFNAAKDMLLKNGETVKEATERNEKLHTEIHDFLVALKNKPYKDKKAWAVELLEIELDGMQRTQKSLETPDEELAILIETRKKWLSTLIK